MPPTKISLSSAILCCKVCDTDFLKEMALASQLLTSLLTCFVADADFLSLCDICDVMNACETYGDALILEPYKYKPCPVDKMERFKRHCLQTCQFQFVMVVLATGRTFVFICSEVWLCRRQTSNFMAWHQFSPSPTPSCNLSCQLFTPWD